MAKLEPMSVEEIKTLLAAQLLRSDVKCSDNPMCCLIFTWANERAEKNNSTWSISRNTYREHIFVNGVKVKNPHYKWEDADWLNEVLDEIGFPHEAR